MGCHVFSFKMNIGTILMAFHPIPCGGTLQKYVWKTLSSSRLYGALSVRSSELSSSSQTHGTNTFGNILHSTFRETRIVLQNKQRECSSTGTHCISKTINNGIHCHGSSL